MPTEVDEEPELTLRESVHGGTHFRLHGRQDTEADPVVLIHGVGLDHTMWAAQVAALEPHHKVFTYDMLGHGLSARPPDERRLTDFVTQLNQLLMNLDTPSAAIIGFSMGGMVAASFAAHHPDKVSRLVLMNTVHRRTAAERAGVIGRYEQTAAGETSGLADAAIARWFSPAFQEAQPDTCETVRTRLLSNDPGGYLKAYRVFATADAEAADRLADIRCPTLVITGALDTGSTPEMAKCLAADIPGAEVRILADLRHMAPLEGADQVNDVLVDFLGSAPTRGL